jgi:hypothetical protein
MLRTGLVSRVLERLDEEAVHAALSMVAQKTGDSARDIIEDAAAMDDVEDMTLVNAAAGALAQAANGAALVILAEAEDDQPPGRPRSLARRHRRLDLQYSLNSYTDETAP